MPRPKLQMVALPADLEPVEPPDPAEEQPPAAPEERLDESEARDLFRYMRDRPPYWLASGDGMAGAHFPTFWYALLAPLVHDADALRQRLDGTLTEWIAQGYAAYHPSVPGSLGHAILTMPGRVALSCALLDEDYLAPPRPDIPG